MTLKELYDKIESYPSDTMNFCIEDVFAWRGIYQEPCCSLSVEKTNKQDNLDKLSDLVKFEFSGWKGGYFKYDWDSTIHFEYDYGEYTDGGYLKGFINKYKDTEEFKHIFEL